MSTAPWNVAELAARAGAEVVARYFCEGVTMRSKAPFNLVSDADVESEHAIAAVIHEHFPEHAILGEEAFSGSIDAEHLWVVDPLDGTNNFAHQVPHFAVSIAYYERGVPQVGVVVNPVHDEWYTARRGAGAYHNGRRCQVATTASLSESLIGVGFYYDRGRTMQATLDAIRDLFHTHIHGIRRFGAAALDLCAVGSGQFGAYFEYQLAPWDFAAGQLFVAEAGGRVTNCAGDPLGLSNSSVLASNGLLHEAVLDIVARHLPR